MQKNPGRDVRDFLFSGCDGLLYITCTLLYIYVKPLPYFFPSSRILIVSFPPITEWKDSWSVAAGLFVSTV